MNQGQVTGEGMTNEQRRAEAVRVAAELAEVCGEAASQYWVWEQTPMPVGLPSDEQLAIGQRMIDRGRAAAQTPAAMRAPVSITADRAKAILADLRTVNPECYEPEWPAALNKIVSDAQVITSLNGAIDERDEEIKALRAMVVRLGGAL